MRYGLPIYNPRVTRRGSFSSSLDEGELECLAESQSLTTAHLNRWAGTSDPLGAVTESPSARDLLRPTAVWAMRRPAQIPMRKIDNHPDRRSHGGDLRGGVSATPLRGDPAPTTAPEADQPHERATRVFCPGIAAAGPRFWGLPLRPATSTRVEARGQGPPQAAA